MHRYTYTAKGNLSLSGVVVKPGDVIAVIETEYRITNISSAIRMDQCECQVVELPAEKPAPTPPPPPPNETTTSGAKPSAETGKRGGLQAKTSNKDKK